MLTFWSDKLHEMKSKLWVHVKMHVIHADHVSAIIFDSSLPSIAEGVGCVTVGLLTLVVGGCA